MKVPLLQIIFIDFNLPQVIRRGDRRPFYAPAKYVIELRPEELEAMRRRSSAAEVAAAAAAAATAASSQPSSSVNSANNNVAAAVRMRHKMSTFGRERNGQHIFNGNNGSTKEHLFLGSSRFQVGRASETFRGRVQIATLYMILCHVNRVLPWTIPAGGWTRRLIRLAHALFLQLSRCNGRKILRRLDRHLCSTSVRI